MTLPIKPPKMQFEGGACFSLFYSLIVSAIYLNFWTWILNLINIVKMLKTKFPTLTPQDPKCQILSHVCSCYNTDWIAKMEVVLDPTITIVL